MKERGDQGWQEEVRDKGKMREWERNVWRDRGLVGMEGQAMPGRIAGLSEECLGRREVL